MSFDFTRSISFTIPGSKTSPDVQVTAVENADGVLVFTVNVVSTGGLTADLRGLFFDFNAPSKLGSLRWDGADVTKFRTAGVIDLGGGVNMHGAASPYDVGLAFGTSGIGKGDDFQSTTFTLSGDVPLTLDDIANVQFGARLTSIGTPEGARNGSSKLVVEAPAAPDARNDSYTIFEDGQGGLSSPSHVPAGELFQVLGNDTDADNDLLTVIEFTSALHGTVEIVDGDDADSLAGDAILYTADVDYAGPDSFFYAISDGAGGRDFAQVDVAVTAVADVPDLTYEIIAGASTDQIIVRVTATQTDADGSEYIDRIELGALPVGVSVTPGTFNPATEPGQVTQDFTLTLPLGQDWSFDFGITAVSKETSNGDEETFSLDVPILLEYTERDYASTFYATNQSMWATGSQFTFVDDRFLGVDNTASPFTASAGGFIGYDVSAAVKAGFQSKLTFEGGEIDANLAYNFEVDTNYNKTTDMLLISSTQMLMGGDFVTEGPQGSYKLDFIFNYDINAALTYDIEWDLGEVDLGLGTVDLGSIDFGSGDIVRLDESDNNTLNVLNLDSDDLEFEIEFPDPFGSVSATLAWPNIETDASGSAPPVGEYTASGSSNNFLELNLDVDQALADVFLRGVNPFSLEANIGIAGATLDLLDLDLFGGLNFLQTFVLQEQSIAATLHFENGFDQAFIFGDDIELSNASLIDAGGNNNGLVEFTLTLDAQAELHNDTDLGFNIGYNFDIFKADYWWDIEVASDSGSFPPLYNTGGTLDIATVGVYDKTFALNFADQDIAFQA